MSVRLSVMHFKSLSFLANIHYLTYPLIFHVCCCFSLCHSFLPHFNIINPPVPLQALSFFLCPPGRPRGFKLRFPLLRSLSNSKVSLDDAEAGHIPTATPLPLRPDQHSPESLGLGEFLPLPPLPPDNREQISGNR